MYRSPPRLSRAHAPDVLGRVWDPEAKDEGQKEHKGVAGAPGQAVKARRRRRGADNQANDEATNILPDGCGQEEILPCDVPLPSFDECAEPTGPTFDKQGLTPPQLFRKFFDKRGFGKNHLGDEALRTKRQGSKFNFVCKTGTTSCFLVQ